MQAFCKANKIPMENIRSNVMYEIVGKRKNIYRHDDVSNHYTIEYLGNDVVEITTSTGESTLFPFDRKEMENAIKIMNRTDSHFEVPWYEKPFECLWRSLPR